MEDKRGLLNREFGGSCEIKSLDEHGRFAGYASVFDVVDSQYDRVRRGAFCSSLKRMAIPQLLWQHQWEHPIGVIEEVFEDDRGLFIQGRLLMAVEKAREAYALLKAGALRGLSIGYQAKQARRDPDSGVRDLLEIDLFEVSIVTMPANQAAQVTVLKNASVAHEALLAALSRAERILTHC